jgi:hypothetical protein
MKILDRIKKMRNNKRIFMLTFVLFILLFSCAKDILVEPPNSLRGYYVGRFYVTTDYSSMNAITRYVNVGWTFSDFGHICSTAVTDLGGLNLCSFTGDYAVENQIYFSGTRKNGLQVCDDEFFPFGYFSIQWHSQDGGRDTLMIQQRNTQDDVFEQAILERQPDLIPE